MGIRERRAAMHEWFIPKRRRCLGGALVVIWSIGMILHPSSHWTWAFVGGLGMNLIISAWPPELHDKR